VSSEGRLLGLAAVILCACVTAPEARRSRTTSIEPFYVDVERLIARHYPVATFERTRDVVRFEHGTRRIPRT